MSRPAPPVAPPAAAVPGERPIVTVDVVLLTLVQQQLHVALVQRDREPFLGRLALPGGWVHVREDLDLGAAAHRVLAEKAGVRSPYLEQLATFGDGVRDARGWSIAVAYTALLPQSDLERIAPEAVSALQWVPAAQPGRLPFDHERIVEAAVLRVRTKARYSSLPLYLMPERFTLNELQQTYEALLGEPLDKRSFRRTVEDFQVLQPCKPPADLKVAHRPPQYYQLKPGVTRQSLATVSRGF